MLRNNGGQPSVDIRKIPAASGGHRAHDALFPCATAEISDGHRMTDTQFDPAVASDEGHLTRDTQPWAALIAEIHNRKEPRYA